MRAFKEILQNLGEEASWEVIAETEEAEGYNFLLTGFDFGISIQGIACRQASACRFKIFGRGTRGLERTRRQLIVGVQIAVCRVILYQDLRLIKFVGN